MAPVKAADFAWGDRLDEGVLETFSSAVEKLKTHDLIMVIDVEDEDDDYIWCLPKELLAELYDAPAEFHEEVLQPIEWTPFVFSCRVVARSHGVGKRSA